MMRDERYKDMIIETNELVHISPYFTGTNSLYIEMGLSCEDLTNRELIQTEVYVMINPLKLTLLITLIQIILL